MTVVTVLTKVNVVTVVIEVTVVAVVGIVTIVRVVILVTVQTWNLSRRHGHFASKFVSPMGKIKL